MVNWTGEGQTTERIRRGFVTHAALVDLIEGIAIDLLQATTPGELQRVSDQLRMAADQVARFQAQQYQEERERA